MTLKRIKSGFKKSLGPHKYHCNFRQKQFSWQGVAAECAQQDILAAFAGDFFKEGRWVPSICLHWGPGELTLHLSRLQILAPGAMQAKLSMKSVREEAPRGRSSQDLPHFRACLMMDGLPIVFMFFPDVARSQFPLCKMMTITPISWDGFEE